jgi:FkbM family methyltransferase
MNNVELIKKIRKLCFSVSFSGKFLLLNRIMRNVFLHAKGFAEIDDFDGNMTIELNLAEHMQSRIFWIGYYSESIVCFLNNFLRPGMFMVDVGANIGEITLVAAKRVTKTGKVISFEPVTAINSILSRNLKKNHITWVTTVKQGLAEKIGEAKIFTNSDKDANKLKHIGLGTLYPMNGRQAPIETISISTLDNYLDEHPTQQLDLIKIDIEGAEIPCLFGAERTIKRFRPHIILETQEDTYIAAGYTPKDLLDFFIPLDYEIFKIGNKGKMYNVTPDSLNEYQNILARPRQSKMDLMP